MSEEELIAAGNDAEILINDDVFNRTVNSLVESSFSTFTSSKPEDTAGREATYSFYRALVDIVHTLQQRVTVRDEIINRNNSEGK
jgi:hypothetical protein